MRRSGSMVAPPACRLWLLLGIAISTAVWSESGSDVSALDFTEDGADACLKCHDESSEYPVLDIFKTRHGHAANQRGPFAAAHQCESCHGPGEEHSKRVRRGQERPPIPFFRGRGEAADAATQSGEDATCLTCHAQQRAWHTSIHADADVGCGDCHRIHATIDAVTDPQLEVERCVACHRDQVADLYKASSHPLRFGEMTCTDCHSAHDSDAPYSLQRSSVNETCHQCHAEKRGPFLWEHPPASEDCLLCHRAHGSNHNAMLTQRPPLLCQQCHSRLDHSQLALGAETLPDFGDLSLLSALTLGQSCGNCHGQVHGSNHPSGASLSR